MLEWNLPYSELRQLQTAPLAAQIARLSQDSQFYRELWGDRDLHFGALPLIAKQDLHEALRYKGLLGSNLCVPADEVRHIHTSSGTSGKPTYFGLTESDYDGWIKIFTRGFRIAGVRVGDRVLHAFAMSRGYAGGVPMVDALSRLGCAALPIGAEAGSARLIDALERLTPRVLYASPSMARHLAERYQEVTGQPARTTSVELLITGGEPGAGDLKSKGVLAATWGAEVREMGGGTDVCPMMVVECDQRDGLHFIAGDEVAMELIDPELGLPLDLSVAVEGEIVYSHLRRRANPVMRMRHGDLVRTQTAPCPCGIKSLRLKFVGRSDDMIIVRGVKVFPSSLQEIVSEFVPRLTGRFLITRPADGKADDALTVSCEASTPNPELAADFEKRARELLGVRVRCDLIAAGTLDSDREQKGQWVKNA